MGPVPADIISLPCSYRCFIAPVTVGRLDAQLISSNPKGKDLMKLSSLSGGRGDGGRGTVGVGGGEEGEGRGRGGGTTPDVWRHVLAVLQPGGPVNCSLRCQHRFPVRDCSTRVHETCLLFTIQRENLVHTAMHRERGNKRD